MAGYVPGSAHQQAHAALQALHERIRRARTELTTVTLQVAEAKTDLAKTNRQAERDRINMEARAAATARGVMQLLDNANAAEKAYAAAVKAHPEDIIEGPRRLRELDREVMASQRHLKAVS